MKKTVDFLQNLYSACVEPLGKIQFFMFYIMNFISKLLSHKNGMSLTLRISKSLLKSWVGQNFGLAASIFPYQSITFLSIDHEQKKI